MSLSIGGILPVILEVIQSIAPLIIFFTVFQILYLKLPPSQLVKLYTGLAFTAIGLILFLYGIYNGFLPAGTKIGEFFGDSRRNFLIPIGFILGLLATLAEPSVRVLCYQVEVSSNGYIRSNLMLYALSLGAVTGPMAVSFLMSMAVGVATAYEGADPVADGFGLIAMIALAPIIFVMLLGVYIRFNGGIKNVQ